MLCNRFALLLISGTILTCASADEGMWTFDNPPLQQLKDKYNFAPSQQWLDHVRLSSVRLNDGGSGSFISPNGLLLTNHHVARGQLQKNSTPEHDFVQNGFYASEPSKELAAPDLEVNVLVSMENVTQRVLSAMAPAAGTAQKPEAAFAARRAIEAQIERESQQQTGLRSDIVTLYQGGEYWLYRYKKYTDVRIVFAPEEQVAYFGGDEDNFTYPRYDLDMAIFRVYDNGKPLATPNYLKWNPKGASDGELVFESGNPGHTERLSTLAQLAFDRDHFLPLMLKIAQSRREVLLRYAAAGPEQARQVTSALLGIENGIKSFSGSYKGLLDPAIMAKKQKEEAEFKASVQAKPELQKLYGSAWDEIAEAENKAALHFKENMFRQLDSQEAAIAAQIVQYVAEVKKPDGQRLPGYHDAQLESLRFRLNSRAPIYPALEIARLTGAIETGVANLGPNDPFLRLVLDGKSPAQAATALVNGSHIADPAFRKKILEGGEGAVSASTDPMIVLARKLDPLRREAIRWNQENVQSVIQQAGEKLGRARFAIYGKSTYPDANFTPRLSYGTVKGYPMNGTIAPYKTTFFGLYDRAYSFDLRSAFSLTPRFQENRNKLNLATPLDFVTTLDTVGGNSGSPVINRAGEIVGLVFDGNIESLVGDYVYDIDTNRTVCVHTGAMTQALGKLYGAQKLLDEIMPGS